MDSDDENLRISDPLPSTSHSQENIPIGEPDLLDLSDSPESTIFHHKEHPANAFPAMEDIRRQGKLCDINLTVGTHTFQAHRIVLAATVPYFRAMFTNDMREANQSEIEILTVEPSAMESLINYAYTGKIVISTNNVQNLMMGASFLQLTRVRDACAEFLQMRLTPQNVLGIRHFAESLGCLNLVTASEKYIQKSFKAVAESEEFMGISFEHMSELISRDELNIDTEEIVFTAVMRWIKYDVLTRSVYLPKLLVRVRLPLLTPQFLADKVSSEEMIRSSHQCRDLLDEARDYHLMPERRPLLNSFKSKPRKCKDLVGVIYAVGGQTKSGNSLSTVEVYDPITRRWRDAEAMSMHRSRVGVAVMQNRLYAIGGYNGQERLNTVEVFDAESKKWSKVASMNCKRSAVGAVALGDHLYVCGGFDGISSLDTVERYNPEENNWTMMPTMTKHRSAAGVVQLNGKIYALGGHNGLSIFDSVEVYDTRTESWTETVPMLSKRCRLGVATLNGKIFACGGYDGSSFLRSVECFDPDTNKWSYVQSMNVTRSRVALVADMDKLWAIGGYDGMKNLKTSGNIDSMSVISPGLRGYTPRTQQYIQGGGGGVQTLPRNSVDNNMNHNVICQTLPSRSSSQKLGNQLSSSPVPSSSQQQQMYIQQKLQQQQQQQQVLLQHQMTSQHQQQLSQHQLMTSQAQQPITSQHQQHLSHHQLMTSQPQQMTSQQLLQQQILLRQLKPGAAQPPSSPSPTLQHNPPQPRLAPRNHQQPMSMVQKPVLMADQQLNSYTRTTAAGNSSLQHMPNNYTQASMGNNQQQINVSYPSQQLPQKSQALTSAALSQLAAAEQPSTIQQLSKQALSLQQQQEQLQQILEQQQRIKDEEIMLAKLHGVRMETQTPQSVTSQGSDRTYMNVQPVAVIGRGGKILNQPEINQNVAAQGAAGGKKVPIIPKSQEVKHKKEPLYSTILQYSNNDQNKALRSTDSQCSADEEPTEGLPNLETNSPVSSSYSELRQAAQRVGFNGDGSIYEPVLPPKGIPGPNSIHFKSLSGGSTDSDYFGSCVKCGRKIIGDGSGCSAMGRLYHVQCFTCTECNIVLQGLPFYAVEGSPLCEADYLNTLEKCCKCYKPILDRILRATGKPYHPNCFTCVACHKSLDGIPFTVDATNQIHCIEDFHKRFAPRCSVCKDPIMPTPGEEETVRVVALDRSFHINCYRCVDCNLLLSSDEDGRGCYPLDDTVLCRQCNTTRIQRLTSTIAQD